MQEILRSELGLERTGDFDELEIEIEDEEYEEDEKIEEEIVDDIIGRFFMKVASEILFLNLNNS